MGTTKIHGYLSYISTYTKLVAARVRLAKLHRVAKRPVGGS